MNIQYVGIVWNQSRRKQVKTNEVNEMVEENDEVVIDFSKPNDEDEDDDLEDLEDDEEENEQ